MKEWIKGMLSIESSGRWILAGLYGHPIRFIFVIIKSMYATYRLTNKAFPIRVRLGIGQTVIIKAQNANVLLDGNIYIENWQGNADTSSIILSYGSTLKVFGDLVLGPGVHIFIANEAILEFGGQRLSTASGITCNSRIMVEKHVQIGADTIIAWDVFISDSDWHDISWGERVEPILIGDNVWISHDVSVLKGTNIPNGCVVGAKSLVSKGEFEEKSILAGIPATVRRKNVEWKR